MRSFVFISSASIYGKNNEACKESTTPYPQNNYAELKLKSEVLITKIIEETSVENIVLARLFNMYGYHDRFSIISKLINVINKEDEVNINNMGKARETLYL